MDKSPAIRDWIRNHFDIDWSNRELSKLEFQKFFEQNQESEIKELEINWKKHRTLFIEQFKKICKEKSISPTTYGYAEEKITFMPRTEKEPRVTIKPKPKGGGAAEITKIETEAGKETTEEQAPKRIILSIEQSEKLTRIIWKIIGNILHAWKEGFDKFDEEELEELALGWNPLFKPYLERFGGQLGAALLITTGVFASKGRPKAFKVKKKDEKEKSEEQEEEKIEITKEQSESFEEWKKQKGL